MTLIRNAYYTARIWLAQPVTTKRLRVPRIDGAHAAENVANAVGSWRFIGGQAAAMLLWIVFNALQLTGALHFDAYPYIALNLAMSAEAAFTGPILLIAANAGTARDRAQSARIEQLERILDEHVNTTAKQHTEQLAENTTLTREIHALLRAAHATTAQDDSSSTSTSTNTAG